MGHVVGLLGTLGAFMRGRAVGSGRRTLGMQELQVVPRQVRKAGSPGGQRPPVEGEARPVAVCFGGWAGKQCTQEEDLGSVCRCWGGWGTVGFSFRPGSRISEPGVRDTGKPDCEEWRGCSP